MQHESGAVDRVFSIYDLARVVSEHETRERDLREPVEHLRLLAADIPWDRLAQAFGEHSPDVAILNGGWPLWVNEKQPADTIVPRIEAVKFEPKFQADRLEEIDSLKKSVQAGNVTVVDTRTTDVTFPQNGYFLNKWSQMADFPHERGEIDGMKADYPQWRQAQRESRAGIPWPPPAQPYNPSDRPMISFMISVVPP